MDWQRVIERNREALKRVLAGLVAMAGPEIRGQFTHFLSCGAAHPGPALAEMGKMSPHVPAPTLPRHLHRALLRLLRPAESAARRLIVVAARGLAPAPRAHAVENATPRAGGQAVPLAPRKPAPRSAIPLLRRLGIAVVVPSGAAVPAEPAPRPPRPLQLPLCDPLRSYAPRRRTVPPHLAPRIMTFDGAVPHRLPPKPSPGDLVDATRLGRRLAALAAALDDLPRQARRFVRWQARRARDCARDMATERTRTTPWRRWRRLSPLRLGRPPGLRGRGRARDPEVLEILRDLHFFAVEALAPPDTS